MAQIVPQSGPLANVGREIHGITAATLEAFNRAQAEVQLRLLVADDGNVGQRSTELAAAMPRDIVAFLSCFGSVGCLAQHKAASLRNVPLVGPIAGAAPLRGPQSAMSYAVRASAARELQTLLDYIDFLNAWRSTQALPFVFNLAGQANAQFSNRLKGYVGATAFVTVTPNPWAQRTNLQREYQHVASGVGLPLSYLGFEAYINARLLIDSLQLSRARTASELARYLDGLQSRDLGGFTIDYAQRRHGGDYTDLALLRGDGSYLH